MNCTDCGNPKRSNKGVRCATCSSKRTAAEIKKKLGLPVKNELITFSVKVFEPITERWEIWIGYSNWESAAEIKEFFRLEHSNYLDRYKFALFQNNELIESLN